MVGLKLVNKWKTIGFILTRYLAEARRYILDLATDLLTQINARRTYLLLRGYAVTKERQFVNFNCANY